MPRGLRRAPRQSTQPSICLRRRLNLRVPSGKSVFAWRSMPATSISISPMNTGAPSRSDPTDGASSAHLRCGSAARRACAAASPPRRRLHRGARILSQSAQPKRVCPGGGLAVGNTASRRPLSRASDLRRAGSAKTVLSKLLKDLVDPNAAPVRALVREERDLVIAANNSHVLAFDNLSGLPHALSDAFCRLATGASFGLRQLYTDADEVLFQAARPILLNGIDDVIDRSDLADRALFLTLPPIADRRRRVERQLWREFELARPRILGSLLDAATHGLRRLPGLHLKRLPRLADFALWATACETAFWPAGTFAQAYQANRRAAIEDLIDADPVAARIREIMANRSTWTGSASDLLRAGAALADLGLPSGAAVWPKNPRALAGRLRRAQAFLRVLGIHISFGREGRAGTRVITIHARAENTVSAVSIVRDNEHDLRPSQPPPETVDAARDDSRR